MPEWIKDQGSGLIDIENLSMSVHLIPYNDNGKMQVDFSDTKVTIQDYNAHFHGETDFSRAFNVIIRNFKSFFKNEVANIMARKISKAFEDSLNSMLYQGPSILSVMGDDIFLNYTLTGDPIFN
jgi:hypothetical protein